MNSREEMNDEGHCVCKCEGNMNDRLLLEARMTATPHQQIKPCNEMSEPRGRGLVG